MSIDPNTQIAAELITQQRVLVPVLRSDLQFSRQVSQGEIVYVVHDPVTFRSHRLTVQQYVVLSSLSGNQTLSENFHRMLENGCYSAEEETDFLELINTYSRLGLIVLPGANGSKLFAQHQRIKSARRRGRILGALFLQVPLVNPDRFLSRTVHKAAWLFTKTFLVCWLCGMAAAATILFNRFDEVVEPLNGLLATQNIAFLWLSFVLLKIWHELGHGYACKVFGGYVPEMGTVLIAGTPAAFVDATSAWSFPDRYKRLVVMCGGMFFESLVFIVCVFIWAFASSPVLSSCAYQLFVMTSVVTLLFNANPLMKFDGYFITSELLDIPNLRPRADAEIRRILSSIFVGVRNNGSEDSVRNRVLLVSYGVAATIYKFFLVIGIAVLVATKFPLIGLGLAAFHLITTVGLAASRLMRYLLTSQDTQPVRTRARLLAFTLLVVAPVSSLFLPIPFGVVADGLIAATDEHFVNVGTPGVFERSFVTPGEPVTQGSALLQLSNPRAQEELMTAKALLKEAEQRWNMLQSINVVEARRQQAKVQELRLRVIEQKKIVESLSIATPGDGTVVRATPPTNRGLFLHQGTPLAVIVAGKPRLRTWLNEEQLGSVLQQRGTTVTYRIPGRSTASHMGKIVSVKPAAEDVFQNPALTFVTGGEILVDPLTNEPTTPIFQVDIEPNDDTVKLTEHGARISLRLPRRYESIASWTVRKCAHFVQRLLSA